jgi:protein gp37
VHRLRRLEQARAARVLRLVAQDLEEGVMAETTNIEWCDSTWNPWIGCTRVSPACDDCYAARSTPARTMAVSWGPGEPRRRTSEANWGLPLRWERQHEAFFAEHGRRRRVFCASLADVFDNEVPAEWRADLLWLIHQTPHLDWLLLTKRIGNAARMLHEARVTIDPMAEWPEVLPNIWLGATVVNQAEADRDIPKLLDTPARMRFLSIEPMLGPIDLANMEDDGGDAYLDPLTAWTAEEMTEMWGEPMPTHPRIDWVICGGESGPHARPMHPDWPRALRDQCAAAGVPFLFKQWGEWYAEGQVLAHACKTPLWGRSLIATDGDERYTSASVGMHKVGKKAAGRLLDGVEHNGFPA